ncbi:MAG: SLC13 family permease [Phycisphaerae bacterium]
MESAKQPTEPLPARRRRIGMVLALVAASAVYLLVPIHAGETTNNPGEGLTRSGRTVAATAAGMAVLWVTEAIPIPVTALLPIALFPLLTGGTISASRAARPYAHELIFLFMGGFLLALAMQRWGLHRRIALKTILLVGTRPSRLVGGFMLASAVLSMWVSNTATAVMMLPIAVSVIELVRRRSVTGHPPRNADTDGTTTDGDSSALATCLLLGIAYGASIGGIGTLIGTPPNLLLAAFVRDHYGVDISFARWLAVGLPLVALFLPLTWWLLTRVVFPIRLRDLPGGRALIRDELDRQGPISRPEWSVLIVFGLTAAAWIGRRWLAEWELSDGVRPLKGLSDAGIAVVAAVTLFVMPAGRGRGGALLDWAHAVKLPWGILILFGGGLSLGSALQSTGVAAYIGHTVSGFQGLSPVTMILLLTATVVFMTELTSNTATTAALLPVVGAAAVGLNLDPLLLLVPTAVAASCAFMMPVATPPNAVVFSSGDITVAQMCRAGFGLNLMGIALITVLMYTLGATALGIQWP